MEKPEIKYKCIVNFHSADGENFKDDIFTKDTSGYRSKKYPQSVFNYSRVEKSTEMFALCSQDGDTESEMMAESKDAYQVYDDDLGWINYERMSIIKHPLRFYRRKPEVKYRAYKDRSELDNRPMRQLAAKRKGTGFTGAACWDEVIIYVGTLQYTYEEFFNEYEWLDGSPCGVEIED